MMYTLDFSPPFSSFLHLCLSLYRVDDDIPMQTCEPYTLHLTKLSEVGAREGEGIYDECRPDQDEYETVHQT